MLASGETGEEVAERLRWIAKTQMNCTVPEQRLAAVVDKLMALDLRMRWRQP
jgi:hypothetical protein